MEVVKNKIAIPIHVRKSKKRLSKNSKLGNFFVDELRGMYWAEKRLLKSLPQASKCSATAELKAILDSHFTVTARHAAGLDKVFLLTGRKAKAQKSEGIKELLRSLRNTHKHHKTPSMSHDMALILVTQKVVHCQIASYNALIHIARTTGQHDAAKILLNMADEKKAADIIFSKVGESSANVESSLEQD